MSVLIKDVDKELYARFKAAAATRGLRLNDALCQAMLYWLEKETPKNKTDNERMLNNATYRRVVPELLEEHAEKWIVISGGEVIGIFNNREEAIEAIKANNLLGHCNIVSPITTIKRKVTLGFGRRM
ncbi:MAG: hypothetical protein ACFFC7_13805 [Candidatus Hermodarchaeota archaeon]